MRLIFLILVMLLTTSAFAQNNQESPAQYVSSDSVVNFRLFATRNMYTFIKLDTRNGRMWQIQWHTKGSDYRYETTLSDISRVSPEDERMGRFFLYTTTNIYTFILLDQVDGRTWQVQWGSSEERMVLRIY